MTTNDTIHFRASMKTLAAAFESEIGDPNNTRQILFAVANAMQGQVVRYLLPMAERYASQLKTKLRAATRLENGYELSDSQDHKAEIDEQINEIESRLVNLQNQIDEATIVMEEFEKAHDSVVIQTGKGDLFSDIRAKADKKREETARKLAAAEAVTAKTTETALDNHTASSDIVKRQEELRRRFMAA